jgi:hypothetical protein
LSRRLVSVIVKNPPLLKNSPNYQKRDKSLDRKVYSTSKIVADTCGTILRMLVHLCFRTLWASD